MKYIRTKDRIHKRREDTYIEDNVLYQIGYDFGRTCLGTVIAEADTIEELCDLFMNNETKTIFYKYNALDHYVINWETNLVYSLKGLAKEFHSIRGAIYTDKGIDYVAKMNDKGELELI